MPERFLTARQLAHRLGMSVWSVYRAAADGYLPACRLRPRGQLRFDPAAVAEHISRADRAGEFLATIDGRTPRPAA